MLLNIENFEDFDKIGVYKITNLKNQKYYIGSTEQSFKDRYKAHKNALNRGTHKNSHLQKAWLKYGGKMFTFEILEICSKENCREREQYYLDQGDWKKMYNINKKATGPSLESETIEKQLNSRKKTNEKFLLYYRKVKNGEITLNDVPEKYKSRINTWLHFEPWNKGKHYQSTDHLKVHHAKSDRSSAKNTFREKYPIIYVYDSKMKFLGSYRSAKDLEELSLSENFPIKSRFKKERMKIPIKKLQSVNINKCAKTGKPYKGLYFSYEPLHPGTDDANEPKSVKSWNANTEVNIESKKSVSPYSIETETEKSE